MARGLLNGPGARVLLLLFHVSCVHVCVAYRHMCIIFVCVWLYLFVKICVEARVCYDCLSLFLSTLLSKTEFFTDPSPP